MDLSVIWQGLLRARQFGVSALLCLSCIGLPTVSVAAAPFPGSASVTRLIVYYKSANARLTKGSLLTGRTLAAAASSEPLRPPAGTTNARPSKFNESVVLDLPAPLTIAQARIQAARIERDPDVLGVLLDQALRVERIVTNDAYGSYLWNLWDNPGNVPDAGSSRVEPAWSQSRGSGIRIAVLDTGRMTHEDLDGVWVGGYDMISNPELSGDGDGRDANPDDDISCPVVGRRTPHGLMVASVIAARMNNGLGIAGVAPEATIVPIRVLSACYGGTVVDLIDAMRWAVGIQVTGLPANPDPARILNLSLGSSGGDSVCEPVMQEVVNEVLATGAIIVVATGNESLNTISIPASCTGVIAVSASTRDGKRADYSNVGFGTSLAAPGGGCAANSACPTDNAVIVANREFTLPSTSLYGGAKGTSFATPHVAGAAALLLAQNSALTAADVRSRLVNSARPFDPGVCDNDLCGVGMLDVASAVATAGFSIDATASASSVRDGSVVTLTAVHDDLVLSPVYAWEQSGGAAVALEFDDGGRLARFTAPSTTGVVSFRLTVTDAASMSRFAIVSVHVIVKPALVPVATLDVKRGQRIDQALRLVQGGDPEALELDDASLARGIAIEGSSLVWNQPVPGEYTVSVTPYDTLGAGDTSEISILVTDTALPVNGGGQLSQGGESTAGDQTPDPTETVTPTGGGGGAMGLHGAILMTLAAFARRREILRNPDRSQRSLTAAMTVFAAFAVLGTYLSGVTAPIHAWLVGSGNFFWLWAASFVHIDASHLLMNLAGLLLVAFAFGRLTPVSAWVFAFGVAAPVAHAVVVRGGHFAWVAGLSSALHAVVAFTAITLIAEKRLPADSVAGVMTNFGLLLATGLAVKIGLDMIWISEWTHVNARTAGSLHALAAGTGAIGATLWRGLPGITVGWPGAARNGNCNSPSPGLVDAMPLQTRVAVHEARIVHPPSSGHEIPSREYV